MESLEGHWNRFKLTDKEEKGFDIESSLFSEFAGRNNLLLIAKLFSRKKAHKEALHRTLKPIWHTRANFEVRDLGDKRFLLIFDEALDLEKVMVNGPRSFEKHLLAMQRPKEKTSLCLNTVLVTPTQHPLGEYDKARWQMYRE